MLGSSLTGPSKSPSFVITTRVGLSRRNRSEAFKNESVGELIPFIFAVEQAGALIITLEYFIRVNNMEGDFASAEGAKHGFYSPGQRRP